MKNPVDKYTTEELQEMEQLYEKIKSGEPILTFHDAVLTAKLYALITDINEFVQQNTLKDSPPSIWFGNS